MENLVSSFFLFFFEMYVYEMHLNCASGFDRAPKSGTTSTNLQNLTGVLLVFSLGQEGLVQPKGLGTLH